MQVLEKILEEIEETIKRYEENPELITEDITEFCYGMNIAKNIIRKHMKDGWISVDERLPEEKGVYIVTYHPCYWDNVDPEVYVGIDTFRGKTRWAKRKFQRVTAWSPLPEPYRPERIEE